MLTIGARLLKDTFDSLNLPGSVGDVVVDQIRSKIEGELMSGDQHVADKTLNAAGLRDKCLVRINAILDQERPAILARTKELLGARAAAANRVRYLQTLYEDALNRPGGTASAPPPGEGRPQSKLRPPPSAAPDPTWPKLNKTWEMIREEAFAERPQPGAWRHQFQYLASSSSKPSMSGWCKKAKEGSYLNAQGGTVKYWTWYDANVSISHPFENLGPGAAGIWPQMERGRERMLKSPEYAGWQRAYVGDFGLAGFYRDGAGKNASAGCYGWLGPVEINVGINPRWDSDGGDVDPAARDYTVERSLVEAELLCNNIAWVLETWLERPVAAGPGLKGLHFPLRAANYVPRLEDFPAECAAAFLSPPDLGTYQMEFYVTYTARQKTRQDQYTTRFQAFPLERGSGSEAQPVGRAQKELRERIDRVLADIAKQAASDPERYYVVGPTPVPSEGADEAYEIVQRDDCENENIHWVFARRANVVFTVEGHYVPGPPGVHDFAVSPLGQTILSLTLEKLRKEPPLSIGCVGAHAL